MKKILLLFLSISLIAVMLTGCDWRDIFRGQGNKPPSSSSNNPISDKPVVSDIEFNVVSPELLADIEQAKDKVDLEKYTNLVNVVKRVRKSVVKVYSGEEKLSLGVVVAKSELKVTPKVSENSTTSNSTSIETSNTIVSYIVTSHALVSDFAEITINGEDESKYKAYLVGSDPESDLCLLCVQADLEPVEFYNDTALLEVGESVISVGDVLGVADGTVTQGIISAESLRVDSYGYGFNVLSTDALINEGSFGGGLFTSTGFFIGMVSGTFDKYFTTPEKMNFVLSANDVLDFSTQFTKNSTDKTLGYIEGKYCLGIECRDEYANRWGTQIHVVVNTLKDDGCFLLAGLKVGDVIKTIEYKGNVFVPNRTEDLYTYLDSNEFAVGDVLTVSISRGDTSRTIQVQIKQYVYQN